MYKSNRDAALVGLERIPGVAVPQPDGAFYLFPRIEGLTDSFALCRRFLDEAGVGLAPGIAFGESGEGALRLCYAIQPGVLRDALRRLSKLLPWAL
jgi:aspartate/methionine/tyrosine aminotransferase